jgi:hypothetical protein
VISHVKLKTVSEISSISLARANVINILYTDIDQILWTFEYTPGLGKALTRLHLLLPREAEPLIHNIMLHKNSFLLQGRTQKWFWITKVPLHLASTCTGFSISVKAYRVRSYG